MVDTGGGTITIDVPLHRKLSRGSELVYHAGAVGGLTDGDTYTVLEVGDPTGAATGFVRQKVTLSNGLSIGLDARQTDAASMHKLEQLGLKTFASSKVSEHPTTSNLVIDPYRSPGRRPRHLPRAQPRRRSTSRQRLSRPTRSSSPARASRRGRCCRSTSTSRSRSSAAPMTARRSPSRRSATARSRSSRTRSPPAATRTSR